MLSENVIEEYLLLIKAGKMANKYNTDLQELIDMDYIEKAEHTIVIRAGQSPYPNQIVQCDYRLRPKGRDYLKERNLL